MGSSAAGRWCAVSLLGACLLARAVAAEAAPGAEATEGATAGGASPRGAAGAGPTEPAPAATSAPVSSAAEAAKPPAPDSPPSASTPEAFVPIDVVVEGQRPMPPARAAGQQSLKRREIERLPGAFGDPFRALEVMPGVVPIATGLPHFITRGSVPSSVGYFVDGIRVPFLFHLGVGPSVINPALIDGIDFYPGPYPAAYGRHVGGVVAAETRPPSPRLRGEASIRVFDAGAFLEVPLADGDANVFAGGRYSYTAAALSLFAPDTRLSYWDYQAGASYAVSSRDRVSLLAFGSYDYLGEVSGDETERELFGAQFHRIHVRLDHRAPASPDARQRSGPEPSSRAGVTLGYDRTGLGDEGVMQVFGLGVLGSAELPLADVLRVRTGVDLQLDSHDLDREPTAAAPATEQEDADSEEQFIFDVGDSFAIERTAAIGGDVDLVIRPLSELELVPGLRADVYTEDGFALAGVDPRGTVRVHPLGWLTTVSAVGVAHQRPSLLVAVPGLDPQALRGGLQQAVQLSQGLEFALPEEIHATVTVFHHWYTDLTDLAATCATDTGVCTLEDRADGRAYGVEATIRRSLTERLGGMITYTLSRAVRTIDEETTLADFDRTHVLHLVLGLDLGRGWHAGARLTAYSGRPYSLVSFDDPDDPNRATLIGKRNALRRPTFVRLDARLEKRWHIAETGWVSLVFEGMNVTLSKEVVDVDCRVADVIGTSNLRCGGQEIGPITIPSVGVAGGF